MIGQHGLSERIVRVEECLQIDTDEHGPLRIPHHHPRQIEDVLQPHLRPSRDEQHKVSRRIEGLELRLMGVIASKLTFDRLHVLS